MLTGSGAAGLVQRLIPSGHLSRPRLLPRADACEYVARLPLDARACRDVERGVGIIGQQTKGFAQLGARQAGVAPRGSAHT